MKASELLLLVVLLAFSAFVSCNESTSEKKSSKVQIPAQNAWLQEYLDRNFIQICKKKTADEKLDFSVLFKTKAKNYLGFKGKNKTKLSFSLESAKKQGSKQKYAIAGNTVFKSRKKSFKGYIDSVSIYKLKKFSYGADGWMKGKIKDQGIVIARYNFKEDRGAANSGIYRGQVIARWYVDSGGNLCYDDIDSDSDSYSNNQFYGYWKSLRNNEKFVTAWGHQRIPMSGDLDIGAAEFSLNPKYEKYGWGKDATDSSTIGRRIRGVYNCYQDAPEGMDIRNGVSYTIEINEGDVLFHSESYSDSYKYTCSAAQKNDTLYAYFKSVLEGEKDDGIETPMLKIYQKDKKTYILSPLINHNKETLLERDNNGTGVRL